MPTILDWKEIRVATDLKYDSPRASGTHDGFSVNVSVLDRKTGQYSPFIIVGPKLSIPFGLKKKEGPYGARYSCDMAFPGVVKNMVTGQYEGDPELVRFLKFCFELDEKNKAQAFALANEWFKKNVKKEVIDEFYFSNVMTPREEARYSPTLSTRIQHGNEGFKTQFYNQFKREIEFESIGAGLRVIPLIETRGIWIAGKSFGMSLKLVQLLVFERDTFKGCCIDTGLIDDEVPRGVGATGSDSDDPREEGHPRGLAPGMVLPA
jgi:hypothetical protein